MKKLNLDALTVESFITDNRGSVLLGGTVHGNSGHNTCICPASMTCEPCWAVPPTNGQRTCAADCYVSAGPEGGCSLNFPECQPGGGGGGVATGGCTTTNTAVVSCDCGIFTN